VRATDDYFDLPEDVLAQMEKDYARKKTAFGGATRCNSRSQVESNTTRWRLSRFCDVCRAYNIDPLCPISVHLVWIMTSKCQNKSEFIRRFAELTSHEETAACVDMEVTHDTQLLETNNWLTLLQYTTMVEAADDAEPGPLMRRLTECWTKSRLGQEFDSSPLLLRHALLHLMLEDIPAAKILEQKLGFVYKQQEKPACRDLEIRCLRCVASLHDEALTDDTVMYDCLPALLCMNVQPELVRDIVAVLKLQQTQAEAHEQETRKSVGRMQLRVLSKQLHDSKRWVYSVTFDAWVTQQQFAVTTTRRQQLMLYFIKAQRCAVDTSKLTHVFSSNMLRRLDSECLDQIDARAILSVIQSIRVYSHNVTTLVDFRSQCLAGISQSFKKTLSMAQILQLYIACHQHESILESCWKGVVPHWNYTIQCACEKFVKNNAYQVDAVVDCLLKCMLDGEFSTVPASTQSK
jgi:hypothetical protein